MKKYLCTVAYEGTEFSGWEDNSPLVTVEKVLKEALETVLQHKVLLEAASRTDTGVHALGQLAAFTTSSILKPLRIQKSVNSLLGGVIAVLSISEVDLEWSLTNASCKKHYQYSIDNHQVQLPQNRRISWHVPQPLSMKKMQQAAGYLEGTHNFRSLCNFRKGLTYKSYERTVELISIQKSDLIRIDVIGERFLYKMVRNIAGLIVACGLGDMDPEMIPDLLNQKNRVHAGTTAPAHGLTLMSVQIVCEE